MPILISKSFFKACTDLRIRSAAAKRAVGRRKGRHHRVADGLDHRAGLRSDNLVEYAEMLTHEIIGGRCRRRAS